MTRRLLPVCAPLAFAACATNTTKPSCETSNPGIRTRGSRPDDKLAYIEKAGSFCLEIPEKWHRHGKPPDGRIL